MSATTPPPRRVAGGNCSQYPLPRVLFLVYRRRLTGFMSLGVEAGEAGEIYFRDGVPVAALLPHHALDLGRLLFETGVIDEPTYEESLRRMMATGQRHGETLVAMGAITEAQLTAGLKLQLTRKLVQLFAVQRGEFAVHEAEHQYGRGAELRAMRVHPRRIIYHGIRHKYDDTRLDHEAADLNGKTVRLKDSARGSLERYAFDEEGLEVVAALSQRAWTLDELAQVTGQQRTVVRMVLYALHATEALEVTDAGTAETVGVRAPARAPEPARERPVPADVTTRAPAPGRTAPARLPPEIRALVEQVERKAHEVEAQSLFGVLEIPDNAKAEEVREAYLQLAATYHPDRWSAPGLEPWRPLAEKVFARVSEAHSLLSNAAWRGQYVTSLHQGSGAERAQRLVAAELAFQHGTAHLKRKDFARAVEELRRAVELDPDAGAHHAALAWATYQSAADKDAVAAEVKALLGRAVRLAPDFADAHFYQGEVLAGEGAMEAALAAYQRALALKPDHVDAERAVRLITLRLEKRAKKGAKPGLLDRLRRK